MKKSRPNLKFEWDFWENNSLIAGLDEVGRGALAGPIVVAGVILPTWFQDCRIQDSKTISPEKRYYLSKVIEKNALEIRISILGVSTIEKRNPLEATREGMRRVIKTFKLTPHLFLVDGKDSLKMEGVEILNLVKGDSKSINIAAASIVAKVTRDRIMEEWHNLFPAYGWNKNKGYFDATHLSSLLKYGFCQLHRRNYEPVKSLFEKKDIEKLRIKYNKFL